MLLSSMVILCYSQGGYFYVLDVIIVAILNNLGENMYSKIQLFMSRSCRNFQNKHNKRSGIEKADCEGKIILSKYITKGKIESLLKIKTSKEAVSLKNESLL